MRASIVLLAFALVLLQASQVSDAIGTVSCSGFSADAFILKRTAFVVATLDQSFKRVVMLVYRLMHNSKETRM